MRFISLVLSILCVASGTTAHSQLLSERMEGMHRFCLYRANNGQLTGQGETREHRVGLADNCPTQPPDATARPLPATAQLQSEEIVGQGRYCTYEQAGGRWQRILPIGRFCPLSAGLLPPEQPSQARR